MLCAYTYRLLLLQVDRSRHDARPRWSLRDKSWYQNRFSQFVLLLWLLAQSHAGEISTIEYKELVRQLSLHATAGVRGHGYFWHIDCELVASSGDDPRRLPPSICAGGWFLLGGDTKALPGVSSLSEFQQPWPVPRGQSPVKVLRSLRLLKRGSMQSPYWRHHAVDNLLDPQLLALLPRSEWFAVFWDANTLRVADETARCDGDMYPPPRKSMYSAAEGRAAAAHPLMLAVSAAGLLGLLPNTGLRSLLEGQITTAGLLQRYFTDASDPPPASDQSRQNCYHPVAQGLRERAVAVLDRPELGALGKRAALVWARYLSRADPSGDEMDASSDETGAGATNELDVLSRRPDSGMSMLADVCTSRMPVCTSDLK